MENVSGIYSIENIITGKIYIGSSKHCRQRKNDHLYDLRANTHHSIHLQRSFNKHGEENFVFKIIEYVNSDETELLKREQYWLDYLQTYNRDKGYNICKMAGTMSGFKHSDDTKQLLSKMGKGKKRSDETKERMSKNSARIWLGKQRGEEFKKNLQIKNGGDKNGMFHKNHTYETKQKMGKPILQYDIDMNLIKEWDWISQAEKDLNFDASYIVKCCKGKIKQYKGCIWKYKT